MLANRESILGNCWKQGAIVRGSDASHFKSDLAPEDLVIIVSQDCDLLNRSYEAEPNVVIQVVKQISSVDGNLTYGKNPRRLHIENVFASSCGQSAELLSSDMSFGDRAVLEKIQADCSRHLERQALRLIISWISSRYSRFAMPDNFVKRLQPNRKKIEK